MAISGKYLQAIINSQLVEGNHEWSVEEPGDRIDKTTGADNGRGNVEVGVIDTKVSIKFYFDFATGKLGFIRTGTVLTDIQLYASNLGQPPLYTIDAGIVLRVSTQGAVRDKWVVSAEIEAQGDVVTQTDP